MLSRLKKICVIAAHPDDEVLGCGGTIKKLSERGCRVDVLILGEGITSRNNKRDLNTDKLALKELSEKCRRANKILGVESVTLKNFPDNRFDSIDLLDLVKEIEVFLAEKKPEAIFTHSRGDLNIDHQITGRATATACRPSSPLCPDLILSFEILSSTEWNFGSKEHLFGPNFFINIHESLEAKLKAMSLYESELKPFPYPRSLDAIKYQAYTNGSRTGCAAAEAFELTFSRYMG